VHRGRMIETEATRYFYDLTPGRIFDAFEQAGLAIQPTLRWMNSLENRVIGVEDEEGERWVAKFYRPGRWTKEALLEEHAFMDELFRADVPVRPPLILDHGDSVGEIEGILFTVFPHQLGRMPDEITLEHANVLGGLVARIHNAGEQTDLQHRPTIGPSTWGLASLDQLEAEEIVPDRVWEPYEDLVMELIDRLEDQFNEQKTLRVHGDLHRGNILWSSMGPSFVDFDDLTMGPAVQDLWMLLPGRDEDDWILKEAFLRSYESVRPFDREELELVEPLRALKFVRHAAWVARRRNDPAFLKVFPEVETESYWNRELRDLRAQLKIL
jgi:Ser/Thr protein kinase RdoA (MazF antagonist)